ncbi:MAG: hypothetical protein ACE5IR_27495 [bacterium]
MSVQLTFKLSDQKSVNTILQALETYKARLRDSIERTNRQLKNFENSYKVTTDFFLKKMSAEDLTGGDLEYVEWAGEAKILEGLNAELNELENARYHVS